MTTLTQVVTTTATNDFQRYYEEAGPDYAAWSPAFNMHFGYYRRGLNPFARETQLEQMNREILARLNVTKLHSPRILDLGCGLAATLRSISRQCPHAELTGITLVPWQLTEATRLNRSGPESTPATKAIEIQLANYEATPLPSSDYDALYAVESSCYAHAPGKDRFLAEAFRLLRPGGRLVVADGFLNGPLNRIQGPICRTLCKCWAIETLGEIHAFRATLERLGFTDIRIEPAQSRVTLSVMQVPLGHDQIPRQRGPLRHPQNVPRPLEQPPRPHPAALRRQAHRPHGLLPHHRHQTLSSTHNEVGAPGHLAVPSRVTWGVHQCPVPLTLE